MAGGWVPAVARNELAGCVPCANGQCRAHSRTLVPRCAPAAAAAGPLLEEAALKGKKGAVSESEGSDVEPHTPLALDRAASQPLEFALP